VFPIHTPSFLDETTIACTCGHGVHPLAGGGTVTLKNGTWEEPQAVQVVAGPDGAVIPIFEITGADAYATIAVVLGRTPVNGGSFVDEAFVIELPDAAQRFETRVLQLTNFGRSETGNARITTDRQRVLFYASADPARG